MRSRDEPVRLTRIYTRGGDAGETSLGDGSRVSKLDCRIGAFGTVDELNSAIGVVLAGEVPEAVRDALELVQNELFDVGADLSVPWGVTDRLRVEHAMIERLEELCDAFNGELPELKSFILPGGTETAARLHVARTICRRAERDVLLGSQELELNPQVLIYLNRLSDLLFILARLANVAATSPCGSRSSRYPRTAGLASRRRSRPRQALAPRGAPAGAPYSVTPAYARERRIDELGARAASGSFVAGYVGSARAVLGTLGPDRRHQHRSRRRERTSRSPPLRRRPVR